MIGEKSMDNRMKTTIDKLEKYASTTPSKWREALEYRQENKIWLRYSQRIAMLMLDKMDELGINQKQLAEMMFCLVDFTSSLLTVCLSACQKPFHKNCGCRYRPAACNCPICGCGSDRRG